MCLAIVYHDREDDFPLRVFETRDENIYRPSGSRVSPKKKSFDNHWNSVDDLAGLFSIHNDYNKIIESKIVGGLDKHRGTWVALSQTNGVYAKLLIGRFNDGTFGENSTPELLKKREALGYAKRGCLCLDAVSFSSAKEAADKMPELVKKRLEETGKKLLPNYILVADRNDAFVLKMNEDGLQQTIELPQKEVTILSIKGINAPDSVVTQNFLYEFRNTPLPNLTDINGWNTWIKIQSIQNYFGNNWANKKAFAYNDSNWRSHKYSIIQPPYFNVPDDRFHKAYSPDLVKPGDVIEWTSSSTLVSFDKNGKYSFLWNDRFLDKGSKLSQNIEAYNFPKTVEDYQPVLFE